MAVIPFNVTVFRTLFPAFANTTTFPDVFLQAYWDVAGAYISNNSSCSGMTFAQQTLALNLMTAHLVYLSTLIAGGENPGIELSATIDKISVSNMPPPAPNQWQYWLQTSPYGAQLLALLQIAAAGGRMINGYPVFNSFRR